MGQVIMGRAIAGLGGAGMVCMVSILLTGECFASGHFERIIDMSDLLPARDVAAYRSYVNVVQTAGRSCGGAVGGALAQSIGWRWSVLKFSTFCHRG